ncbi:hypothetical protein [Shewanella pneumatophori]|uniref:OmpA-like domain-containing protein n=1 Tax=Shewanella pneumatophori TaxID=314092 RepID=A0A9X1ZQE7_9GAMM|nr:hypothetical protein [Shewanella pneumatophori]MCL1140091.1 hypothetical protein [Shewanella pneumatophori]
MKSLATVLMFLSGSAFAQCDNASHVFDIPYAKNSSYFAGQYASQLDSFSRVAPPSAGYLLLEFKVDPKQLTAEAKQYNKWLAERRIERIKSYLNKTEYSAPVITRILTASNSVDRSVSITWCPDEPEKLALQVASKDD